MGLNITDLDSWSVLLRVPPPSPLMFTAGFKKPLSREANSLSVILPPMPSLPVICLAFCAETVIVVAPSSEEGRTTAS